MSRFVNRTRISGSIPRRLAAEGKFHLLPLYALMRTSALGREAIEGSGSYAFADHIYAGTAAGSGAVGRALDGVLLRLPSARAFRARYDLARSALQRLADERYASGRDAWALAVPCGLARELFDVAATRQASAVHLRGMDLDSELVATLGRRAERLGTDLAFWCGDALDPAAYRADERYDLIVSLGFVDFLDDTDAVRFCGIARERLAPDGRLLTSGFRRHPLSAYLLRELAELDAHYRDEAALRAIAHEAGFARVETQHDRTGLLTVLVAGDA